jgi:Arc/MetJ-type ribon-helix-helix transcriptional regulator
MPRGRAPRGDSPVRWVIWLPGELAAKLELLLYDPVLQRARYGSKSEVCRQALELWLERAQGGEYGAVKNAY